MEFLKNTSLNIMTDQMPHSVGLLISKLNKINLSFGVFHDNWHNGMGIDPFVDFPGE